MAVVTSEAPVRSPRRSAGVSVRLGLFALWAVLTATVLVVGERPASLAELRTAVADGRVHTVSVVGALPPGATGFVTVGVSWREGFARHRTEVVLASPGNATVGDSAADGISRGREVIFTDVATDLVKIDPELVVVRRSNFGSEATVLGRQVPSWLGLARLAVGFLALGLLIGGPQPWRATRWGWCWLMATPIGTPLFLLLSGPTGPLPRPRDPGRRMTGGWALLLAIVITAARSPDF